MYLVGTLVGTGRVLGVEQTDRGIHVRLPHVSQQSFVVCVFIHMILLFSTAAIITLIFSDKKISLSYIVRQNVCILLFTESCTKRKNVVKRQHKL